MMPLLCLFCVVFLVSIILWMIAPQRPSADMKMLFKEQKFAHRGLYNNENGIPENSMLAFQRAIEKGYGIEIDVRLTKDKVPIIFHDGSLKRMCGDDRRPEMLTLAEIKNLRLLNTEEEIPTLEEFLKLVQDKTNILVEFKTGLPGGDVNTLCLTVMNVMDRFSCHYIIESFDYSVLKWFRIYRPQVMRGQLSMGYQCYVPALGKTIARMIPLHRRLMISWLLYNYLARPHFISYRYQDAKLAFNICRMMGAMTSAWTVDRKDTEQALKGRFDAIIFEKFEP